MPGTSLLWRSTVSFTCLKVKPAKCLCLLPVVLVLLFWSWSWSCLHHWGGEKSSTSTDSAQAGVKFHVTVEVFLVVALVAVVAQIALLSRAHLATAAAVVDLTDAELARLPLRTVARVLAVSRRHLATAHTSSSSSSSSVY